MTNFKKSRYEVVLTLIYCYSISGLSSWTPYGSWTAGLSPSGLLGQMQGAHHGPMMQVCINGAFEISLFDVIGDINVVDIQ